MNSIQLELFSQEAIHVGINRRAGIICFDFEGRQGWVGLWECFMIQDVFEGVGVSQFNDIFTVPDCSKILSHTFLCPSGTWQEVEAHSEFYSSDGADLLGQDWAPPWGRLRGRL